MVELKGLHNCWLSPEGKVHDVPPWGHDHFAYANILPPDTPFEVFDLGYTRVLGWVKLTEGDWRCSRGVTQAQLEVIFDWHIVNKKHFNADLYEIR